MPTSTVLVEPLPKALAFDVFGTVVDWYGGVSSQAAALAAGHGQTGDWGEFARQWRAGYAPAMDEVRRGLRPWASIDTLHRELLERLIERHALQAWSEAERRALNRAWHRLPPWPDVVPGLARLKQLAIVTPLSNGNFSLLTDMAKHAGLPWDCVISAELFGHYKPDPQTYLGCARLLDLAPCEVMMVACHPSDLRAARAAGLRCAYVARPLEHGPATVLAQVQEGEFDVCARDFVHLAEWLEAAR